ncbi:glycosyltransferase family 2 protein [Rubinisphaera margarita]|uniref:glycosyltransferase family 2 protein n=1 Tax=Rubinisphaera margarita TaxID=2909586 RepID=UPI001EE822D9|nr:glycosyltransferase family 2 protein [Rubinisphaera margarita]MCG6154850.1 glycosyltransferase family 2 protein [Rubinisphaera margarita]
MPQSDTNRGTWIIVAAYNEGSRLSSTLSKLTRQSFNVVVVDDGSSDDTAAIAARFPVWVLRHPINCGQGAALKTGIDFALARGAEYLVTFDGDGQHEVDEIPRLLTPLVSGKADAALGSRFLGVARNMPFTRWLTLKAGILFTRVVSGVRVTDVHNGFRAMTRRAASVISIRQPRMAHASEILDEICLHGLRFVEVPVTITYATDTLEKGQSSLGALRITGHLLVGRIWR